MSRQLQAMAALPRSKSPPPLNPLNRTLDGPQSRSARGGEEKISLPGIQKCVRSLNDYEFTQRMEFKRNFTGCLIPGIPFFVLLLLKMRDLRFS